MLQGLFPPQFPNGYVLEIVEGYREVLRQCLFFGVQSGWSAYKNYRRLWWCGMDSGVFEPRM